MVNHTGTRYATERFHAVHSVAAASTLARRLQKTFFSISTLEKPDTSPVTVADFAVQALIVSHLHSKFPTDCFIAEETTTALRMDPELLSAVAEVAHMEEANVLKVIDLCGHEGGDGKRTWILDPIDGTRGFIAMRQYCIALGLVEGGKARVGVLGCPNLDSENGEEGCLFYAEDGEGTWQVSEVDASKMFEEVQHKGKRCVVADISNPEKAVFSESVESAHSSHDLSAKVAQILKVKAPPVRMDSQAKYGCMARGDVSIFLRFPRHGYVENVWDSAPATIIVEEAGGKVTDGRGRPLDFGLGKKLDNDDGIVATNGLMHDKVIAAVQQAMRETASA